MNAKAAITWVSVASGVEAEVRLHDHLFSEPQPDAGGKDFLEALNPNSLKVITAYMEPHWLLRSRRRSSSSSGSGMLRQTGWTTCREPSRSSDG